MTTITAPRKATLYRMATDKHVCPHVGGYDDLRRNFGKSVPDPKATSYTAVVALFGMTALMALAASYLGYSGPFTLRVAEKFVGFSMAVLSSLKARFPFYRRCTC